MAFRTNNSIRRIIRRTQLRQMVLLADSTSMRWSSVESFHDALPCRRAALYGFGCLCRPPSIRRCPSGVAYHS